MALPSVKKGAIVDNAGNILIHVILDANLALPTVTSSNTTRLGEIANTTVGQSSTKTEIKNEAGETVKSSYDVTRTTTGTLLQCDKDLIDYLGDTVKGADILEIKYTGVVDGKDQWHFKVGSCTPQFAVARPGGQSSMAYEFTGYDLTSDFVVTATALASIASVLSLSTSSFFPTTTVTISSSKSFEVVEVS